MYPLDILLRALLADLALGAVGLADPHLEGIMAAVQPDVPRPSVADERAARR